MQYQVEIVEPLWFGFVNKQKNQIKSREKTEIKDKGLRIKEQGSREKTGVRCQGPGFRGERQRAEASQLKSENLNYRSDTWRKRLRCASAPFNHQSSIQNRGSGIRITSD